MNNDLQSSLNKCIKNKDASSPYKGYKLRIEKDKKVAGQSEYEKDDCSGTPKKTLFVDGTCFGADKFSVKMTCNPNGEGAKREIWTENNACSGTPPLSQDYYKTCHTEPPPPPPPTPCGANTADSSAAVVLEKSDGKASNCADIKSKDWCGKNKGGTFCCMTCGYSTAPSSSPGASGVQTTTPLYLLTAIAAVGAGSGLY
jgi:hypothetical protein